LPAAGSCFPSETKQGSNSKPIPYSIDLSVQTGAKESVRSIWHLNHTCMHDAYSTASVYVLGFDCTPLRPDQQACMNLDGKRASSSIHATCLRATHSFVYGRTSRVATRCLLTFLFFCERLASLKNIRTYNVSGMCLLNPPVRASICPSIICHKMATRVLTYFDMSNTRLYNLK
jgi:hypothetical protein